MSLFESLQEANRFYHPESAHWDWVRELALRWISEADPRRSFIECKLQKPNVQVTFAWIDDPAVTADFLPFPGTGDQPESWAVRLSLGLFPKGLALCSRVLSVKDPLGANYIDRSSFLDWDDTKCDIGTLVWDHTGELQSRCSRIVVDMAHLAVFHELSHGVEGHRAVTSDEPNLRRALESSADVEAGSLFWWFLQSEERENNPIGSDENLFRLVDAGYFLTTLFYRSGPTGPDYHLPMTRFKCFLLGAALASGGDIDSEYARLARLATARTEPYCLTLVTNDDHDRFRFWVDMAAVSQDWEVFRSVTLPLIVRARGDLRKLGMINDLRS